MGVSTTLLGTQLPGQADTAVNRDTPFTLVLGGGGMKGLAHIGVIQALLERGHRPTRIVGSSVGALVGAAWAGGMGIAKLREIALGLKRKDVFAVAHADMAFKRMRSPALFRREPLADLIARTVGDLTFQQLDPPVIVNTVDLNSGMEVFWGLPGLDEIRVADAVFASCALPGYFPPHEIGGRFFVDGAVVANVPYDAARALGPELIIAVDVSASSVLTADAQDEGFAGVFARATEILMQTLLEQRVRTWTTPPVYYIQPRVEHVTMFSFDHLREEVEEGYRATSASPTSNSSSAPTVPATRFAISVPTQKSASSSCFSILPNFSTPFSAPSKSAPSPFPSTPKPNRTITNISSTTPALT